VKKLIVLKVLLVLVGCFNSFVGESNASSYTHHPTGLTFQDSIAGLVKGEITHYKDPRLGVSVGYNAPGITSTVYIYNLGIRKIQTVPPSPILDEHFKQVIEEIYTIEKQGGYENVRAISHRATLRYDANGKQRVLLAIYSYLQNEGKRVLDKPIQRMSVIYLTGYRNHFVKVRFTYNEEIQFQGDEACRRFFDEIEKTLSK